MEGPARSMNPLFLLKSDPFPFLPPFIEAVSQP